MPRILSLSLLAGRALLTLMACDSSSAPGAAPGVPAPLGTAAPTSRPGQARLMAGVAGAVRPNLTVGDGLLDGNFWAPTPDGLGGFSERDGDIVLFANHEINSAGIRHVTSAAQFQYSRVLRLTLDRSTLSVKDTSYVVNGSEQYLRLCSATFVDWREGFPSGHFLTGEEQLGGAHNGVQDEAGIVNDSGKLYVFTSTGAPHAGYLTVGREITGG